MTTDIRDLLNKLNECACGGQLTPVASSRPTVNVAMSINYTLSDGTSVSKSEFATEEEFAEIAQMVRSMENVVSYNISINEYLS